MIEVIQKESLLKRSFHYGKFQSYTKAEEYNERNYFSLSFNNYQSCFIFTPTSHPLPHFLKQKGLWKSSTSIVSFYRWVNSIPEKSKDLPSAHRPEKTHKLTMPREKWRKEFQSQWSILTDATESLWYMGLRKVSGIWSKRSPWLLCISNMDQRQYIPHSH